MSTNAARSQNAGTPLFEGRPLDRPTEDVEDQGLAFDLATVVTRRRTLGVLGAGAAAAVLAACGGGTSTSSGASDSGGAAASDAGGNDAATSGTEMPTETAGPYPGDGSNGADVLEISGVERSDIRSSIDGGATAEGVALTLTMNIVDLVEDGAAMTGAAVYVWHCDAQGGYSMYGDGLTEETYLRGVQVVGEDGTVTFTTIFPGCYTGRWPHIHFEVFPDLSSITDATNTVLTSQIALPEEDCTAVYARSEYSGSAENLAQITLESDNVFSDGVDMQLATMSGDVDSGYTATIDVPIDTSTAPEVADMGGGAGGPGDGGQPPEGGQPPAGAPDGQAPTDEGASDGGASDGGTSESGTTGP
ncbi:3,4-dioxygenase subunit beta [Brachybacterium sp.]|uniref:dioxygenase family protein n=1 Tax=Brachybacterium sp. TaxID=1891286 RepID=UPI002ED1AB1A